MQQDHGTFEVLLPRRTHSQSRAKQVLLGTVPVVVLGLCAVAAIVQHASWHQGADVMSTSKLVWGSGEEFGHKVMVSTADSVGKYDYGVAPLPINPMIIDEVKKAEAEQGKESKTLAAYAMGKEPEAEKKPEAATEEYGDDEMMGSQAEGAEDPEQDDDESQEKQLSPKEAALAKDDDGAENNQGFASLAKGGHHDEIDHAAGEWAQ